MIDDKIIEELKAENEKHISNINLLLVKHFEFQTVNEKTQERKINMKSNYKNIDDANNKIDSIIKQFEIFKEQIQKENKQLKKENEQLKHRLSHLVRENTKLQNDLFSEQLLQDETDDYIDKLKNELFNAYLEIESDNVNIQLSHYHIKKLLKIIDEHTLINPYTN